MKQLFNLNSDNGPSWKVSCEKFTRREKEILDHISHGLSSKQIAAQLFISEYTVENHRKSMLKKSGARNCAELVQMALSGSLSGKNDGKQLFF